MFMPASSAMRYLHQQSTQPGEPHCACDWPPNSVAVSLGGRRTAPEDVRQRHPINLLGAAAHAALHLGSAAAPCSSGRRSLLYHPHSSGATHKVLTISCSGFVLGIHASCTCRVVGLQGWVARQRGGCGGGHPRRREQAAAPRAHVHHAAEGKCSTTPPQHGLWAAVPARNSCILFNSHAAFQCEASAVKCCSSAETRR